MTVDYATAERHGDGARPTTPPTSGTLTFAPGQTTQDRHGRRSTATLLDEVDETFSVNLSSAGQRDDRRRPGRRHDHRRRRAADALDQRRRPSPRATPARSNATFTVSLERRQRPDGHASTTRPPTARRRAGPTTRRPSGTLTFAAGQTTQTVTVPVNGDVLDEVDETFSVNLSSPVNATIADGQGLGTITDDDAPPTLSIDDVTVTEGDAGTVDATFTVTPQRAQRPDGHGRLRHGRRHGDRAGRLRRDERRRSTFAAGRDDARRSPSRSTATCSTRSNETFSRQPVGADQRDDRRRHGRRHDHRRRRRARRSRSTT